MITISKEKKKTMHIASCSFGKDSLATILLALEHGEPLDEAVYCEVMFDKRTSGEVPEHRAFIYETALPRLKRLGIPVRVLRSDKTYLGFVCRNSYSRFEKRTSARIPSVRALLRSAGLQAPSHPPV